MGTYPREMREEGVDESPCGFHRNAEPSRAIGQASCSEAVDDAVGDNLRLRTLVPRHGAGFRSCHIN